MENPKKVTVLVVVTCREEGCGFEQAVTLSEEYRAEFADLDLANPKDREDMALRLVEDRVEGLGCPKPEHYDVGWMIVPAGPTVSR